MTAENQLAQIEKISVMARTNWVGLIALTVFTAVTIMRHEDAHFFIPDAQTKLPLIGVSIPVPYFFIAAPMLLSAVYIYLHLYLSSLWPLLSQAPYEVDNNPLADRVFPWLVTQAFLWQRQTTRQDGSAAPAPFGVVIAIVTIFVTWVGPLIVLGWMWWRSLPNHEVWISTAIGLCFCLTALVGGWNLRAAVHFGRHRSRTINLPADRWLWAAILFGLALLYPLSLAPIDGVKTVLQRILFPNAIERYDWHGFINRERHQQASTDPLPWPLIRERWQEHMSRFDWVVRADLAEVALAIQPTTWIPYEDWLEDFFSKQVDHKSDKFRPETPNDLEADEQRAFWVTARKEWKKQLYPLKVPDLSGRQLSHARGVRLVATKANLSSAQLQGAVLWNAQLQGAELSSAQLQGADLWEAQLQGADLWDAQLQGADLWDAQLQGADLSFAQLQGAKLWNSQLQGADLISAQLLGADLRRAQLQGAELRNAQLQGANLWDAQLQGANLRSAQLQGADLSFAQLQGADLRNASLAQQQLAITVGDELTWLPRRLWVLSCSPVRSSPNQCKEGESPNPTGRWSVDCAEFADDPTTKRTEDGFCYTLVEDHLDELLPAASTEIID